MAIACRGCTCCEEGEYSNSLKTSPVSGPEKSQRMRDGGPAKLNELNVPNANYSNSPKIRSPNKKKRRKLKGNDAHESDINEASADSSRSPPVYSDIIAALYALANALTLSTQNAQTACCCNLNSNEIPKISSNSKRTITSPKKKTSASMQQKLAENSNKEVAPQHPLNISQAENSSNSYDSNTPEETYSFLREANYELASYHSFPIQSQNPSYDSTANNYYQRMPEVINTRTVPECCCCCCHCYSPESFNQAADSVAAQEQITKQSFSLVQLNSDEFTKCMDTIYVQLKRMQKEDTLTVGQKDDKCRCGCAMQDENTLTVGKKENNKDKCRCGCGCALQDEEEDEENSSQSDFAKTTLIYERPDGIVTAEGTNSMTALMNDWKSSPMPDDAQKQRANEEANIAEHKRSVKAAMHRAIETYSRTEEFDILAKAIAKQETDGKQVANFIDFCEMLSKITQSNEQGEKQNEQGEKQNEQGEKQNEQGAKQTDKNIEKKDVAKKRTTPPNQKNRSSSSSTSPKKPSKSRPYPAYDTRPKPPHPNLRNTNFCNVNCYQPCENINPCMQTHTYPTRCPQKCTNTINMQAYCYPYNMY